MHNEYAMVVLNDDRPDVGLAAGDVGVVLKVLDGGAAYEVDFVLATGRSAASLTLPLAAIRSRAMDELLHVRRFG